MRHGDFSNWCNGNPLEECFPSVAVIARRVREVQEELLLKYPGMNVNHVVMTSDERDEAWWDQIKTQGWYRLDHSNTSEQYGTWFVLPYLFPRTGTSLSTVRYPVIIDAVVQSKGMGFIGTHLSTFSVLARRRVEDWQRGATRTVKWGYKGADDH